MGKEAEVRLSYNSLVHSSRPDIALFWNNQSFINWAQKTGYQGVEFLPFKGPAQDIIRKPIEVICEMPEIKSGHVFYNPYATFWSILTRKEDPLRPGTKLAYYNLFMAEPNLGKKVLHKLERAFGKEFPVVTYPFRKSRLEPYGTYQKAWLQTHPAVFNDDSGADDLIHLVEKGVYKGIVWDTFHAMEETNTRTTPLRNWELALGKLLEAGVIREIHVQAARFAEKYGKVPDMQWARELTGENPKYNSELGKIIKLVKSVNQEIPFVIEISPQGLFNAGVLKPRTFLKTSGDFQTIHREIIDYIKRI